MTRTVTQLSVHQSSPESRPRPLEHHEVGASLKDSLERQLIEFIRADSLIEAIKLYRKNTGLELKETEDAVDELKRLNGE